MNSLVAYYSLSGNTEKVAKAIADALSADLESVRDANPRGSLVGMLRSLWEAVFKLKPKIAPFTRDVADYDLVILGCPVWAQDMAAPMRSFLAGEQGRRIRRLALFCTQGGSGAEHAMRQMADLAGCEPVAQLVVLEGDLKSGKHGAAVDAFVQHVRYVENPLRIGAAAA